MHDLDSAGRLAMNDLRQAVGNFGFGRWHMVRDRASIADIFRPPDRCGIYVLSFANGEAYVGQAVDVTRRYVQHRKVHTDIETMTFKTVKQDDLDQVERTIIRKLESAEIKLRNVVFTSIPYGPSDFDLIMPAEDQGRWLAGNTYANLDGPRNEDSEVRRRFTRKYREFLQRPKADNVVRVLRTYVHIGIPAIPRSEMSFWGSSCLPGNSNREDAVYSRINIYQQEVFTASMEAGELLFTFRLAKSPLQRAFGRLLLRMRWKYPWVGVGGHVYEPGGQDQIALAVQGVDAALKLMRDSDVITAVRLFNLRLMKKGPCMFSRYHCFDLADRFYEQEIDSDLVDQQSGTLLSRVRSLFGRP